MSYITLCSCVIEHMLILVCINEIRKLILLVTFLILPNLSVLSILVDRVKDEFIDKCWCDLLHRCGNLPGI